MDRNHWLRHPVVRVVQAVSHERILALIGRDGSVLDCTYLPGFYDTYYEHVLGLLSVTHANISDLFLLPRGKNLIDCAARYPLTGPLIHYPARPEVSNLAGATDIYSLSPTFQIELIDTGEPALLGVILLYKLVKLIDREPGAPLFCLDEKERLVAFNTAFHARLRASAELAPLKMLGTPFRSLFNRTPADLSVAPSETAPSPALLTRFDSFGPVALSRLGSEDAADSSGIRGSLYRAPETVDLENQEVIISLEFAGGARKLPCVVLGDPFGKFFSDREGYLAGPDPSGRLLLLKKGGQEIARVPLELPDPTLAFTLSWKGSLFQARLNGKTILSLRDPRAIKRNNATVFLYDRKGAESRLERLRIQAGPYSGHDDKGCVAFEKAGAKRGFEFEPLCCLELAETGLCTLYRLHEQGDIQSRLDGLQEDFRLLSRKNLTRETLLGHFEGDEYAFIGASPEILRIRENAERVAASELPVLITGPTGTGKEVLARHIHRNSLFREGPFIKADLATLPPNLIESLLFGHEKGAFTGAVASRSGLFEQAEQGTLFLDEVSNLGYDLQAKLLQFLQDHTVSRLGGNAARRLSLRIVVASNVPLEELVRQKRFREDLYYRMAVVSLRLPPLRERTEDLLPLTNHFLDLFREKYRKPVTELAPEASRKLLAHAWPGNIRELRNVLERAFFLSSSGRITAEDIQFPDHLHGDTDSPAEASCRRRKVYRSIDLSVTEFEALVRKFRGNLARAARELDVSKRNLYNFMLKNGLRPDQYR